MAITTKIGMIAPPPWWDRDTFYYVCEPAAGLPLGAKIKILRKIHDPLSLMDVVIIKWGDKNVTIIEEEFNRVLLRRTPTKEAELAAFGLRLEGKQ